MLNNLTKKHNIRTFSLSAENFNGEKGKGGMAVDGTGADAARDLGQGWKVNPYVRIEPHQTFTAADIHGEGAVKHIWMTVAAPVRALIIRVYYDGCDTPAIECPLGDFFANANHTDFRQIASLAVCVNPINGQNSYWEMPYKKGLRMTVENVSDVGCVLYYQIDCEEKDIGDDFLYFHALFRRTNPLPYKEPYTILNTIHGNGQYVGTYMYWGVNNNGWWGEGEIKFYIDGDDKFPSICGTGTEDYFCGSNNFDVGGKYVEFSTPYSGLSKIDKTDDLYQANRRFNLYRWHITDPIYFQKDLRVTIQALGWRSGGRFLPLQDDISSVAFWYSDAPCNEETMNSDKDFLEIV